MRITFTCSKKFKVGFTLKANTAFTMYNSGNLYINFIVSNKTESLLWKKKDILLQVIFYRINRNINGL